MCVTINNDDDVISLLFQTCLHIMSVKTSENKEAWLTVLYHCNILLYPYCHRHPAACTCLHPENVS
jgi:hypothetical protein